MGAVGALVLAEPEGLHHRAVTHLSSDSGSSEGQNMEVPCLPLLLDVKPGVRMAWLSLKKKPKRTLPALKIDHVERKQRQAPPVTVEQLDLLEKTTLFQSSGQSGPSGIAGIATQPSGAGSLATEQGWC